MQSANTFSNILKNAFLKCNQTFKKIARSSLLGAANYISLSQVGANLNMLGNTAAVLLHRAAADMKRKPKETIIFSGQVLHDYFLILCFDPVCWKTEELAMRLSIYLLRTSFSDLSFKFSSLMESTRCDRSSKVF